MLDWLIPSLLVLTLSLWVIGGLRRVAMWRQGQPNPVAFFPAIKSILPRYLKDLHHVVERDKYMSNTHVATAGGFVLSMVLIILVYLFDLSPEILGKLLLVSLAIMFVGACFVAKRRMNPPSRLSKGPWMRLPKSLLSFSISFFILTLPASGILPENTFSWVLVAILAAFSFIGLSELIFGMTWGGPMKHAFAGALHLGFHRRPERFGGGRSTGLKKLDLSSTKLGVEMPSDFKWNQLLGFDACVQCGRCEAMCPAFAAGQPLNPKKVIQDLVIGMSGKSDASYHGSPYPGTETGQHSGNMHEPIVNGLIEPETLWSCTTCRACVEECPMFIEHVDAIVDMRRFLTLEKGATAGQGSQVIDNLIATDNPNGYNPTHRMNWAADQNLPLLKDVKNTKVLLWMGDAAFDMRGQRTLRAVVKLLRAAKVEFAVLGNEERDSGDVARRLGDEATFQRLASANIATLRQYHFDLIVTADPHAFHVISNEYPELGGQYQVLHHTTFMSQMAEQGRLNLKDDLRGKVTYHDPCYLGRYNGEFDAPRNLLKSMGADLIEMERSNFRSRCCGGGGGAPVTDIPGERRIPDMRIEDANATGAELVAVACPQCALMLEGVVTPRPEIKDIAELLVEQLQVEEAVSTSKSPEEVH